MIDTRTTTLRPAADVRRSSARPLRLAVAAGAGVLFLLLYALTNLTAAGQTVENGALGNWYEDQVAVWLPYHYLHLPPFFNEKPTLVVGVLLAVAIAAIRRRWRDAITVLVAGPAAIVVSQVFKDVVGRPHLVHSRDLDPSYPSGHFMVAAVITMSLLIVLPRVWLRWVAPVLLAWTALIASGVMAMGWHRLSDVPGGALLVVAIFLAVQAVVARDRAPLPMSGRRIAVLAAVVVVFAAVGAIVPGAWAIPFIGLSGAVGTAIIAVAALRWGRTDVEPGTPSGLPAPAAA